MALSKGLSSAKLDRSAQQEVVMRFKITVVQNGVLGDVKNVPIDAVQAAMRDLAQHITKLKRGDKITVERTI